MFLLQNDYFFMGTVEESIEKINYDETGMKGKKYDKK